MPAAEVAHLAQASNFTTPNPQHGTLDLAQAHAGWADKPARTLGVSLASVAPSVWHGQSRRADARTRGAAGGVLTELELSRAAQKAVGAKCQETCKLCPAASAAPRRNSVTPNSACCAAARHLTTPRTSLEWRHHLTRAPGAPRAQPGGSIDAGFLRRAIRRRTRARG